jgi:SAM-dependent methyltransferase
MSSTAPTQSSAERWGPLWGSRAPDWAEIEKQQLPTYEEAIRRLGVAPGQRVLEIGCGSGVFLRAAAERGAEVTGLDASAALLELARARVPDAELRLGDMESLPFDDDVFDVVTGFNSFFFAADLVAALREAGRVAKPGAPVVIQVWGRPEACDVTAMKQVLAPYLPPPPPAPPLWQPGVLEGIARDAGLLPREAFDLVWAYEFADEDALGRAMLSPGNVAVALRSADEATLRSAIVGALAPYRTPTGAYRLENEWHYLIASA